MGLGGLKRAMYQGFWQKRENRRVRHLVWLGIGGCIVRYAAKICGSRWDCCLTIRPQEAALDSSDRQRATAPDENLVVLLATSVLLQEIKSLHILYAVCHCGVLVELNPVLTYQCYACLLNRSRPEYETPYSKIHVVAFRSLPRIINSSQNSPLMRSCLIVLVLVLIST